MSKKKMLILVTVAALLTVCMVGLTTAYLTSTSDAIANVLEAGKTKVTEEEPSWDPEDPHPLLPGKVYAKDPTATLKAGSVPSYVFMEVTAPKALRDILDDDAGYPTVSTDWKWYKDVENGSSVTSIYYYSGTALEGIEDVSGEDIKLAPLFEQIKIKADATEDELIAALGSADETATVSIEVVSKSCQMEGFANAKDAYDAAFAPAPVEEPPAEESAE